jgi:hypothetical protein|tara:strand:+ start:1635 stop:1862 length:228 start_codon:yes stop_codon:yes gene_type:complete
MRERGFVNDAARINTRKLGGEKVNRRLPRRHHRHRRQRKLLLLLLLLRLLRHSVTTRTKGQRRRQLKLIATDEHF